jgi:hypothetical protein
VNLEHAAALIPCLVVLVLPGWSLWRMVKGLRAGDWRRPAWFGHATWASFFLMVLAWLWGLAAGPALQSLEEKCSIRHHQPYDDAYYQAHRDDYHRLFPLSSKCNADYDLVPAWVNPTIAVFLLLLAVSIAGLVWTSAHRSTVKGNSP